MFDECLVLLPRFYLGEGIDFRDLVGRLPPLKPTSPFPVAGSQPLLAPFCSFPKAALCFPPIPPHLSTFCQRKPTGVKKVVTSNKANKI